MIKDSLCNELRLLLQHTQNSWTRRRCCTSSTHTHTADEALSYNSAMGSLQLMMMMMVMKMEKRNKHRQRTENTGKQTVNWMNEQARTAMGDKADQAEGASTEQTVLQAAFICEAIAECRCNGFGVGDIRQITRERGSTTATTVQQTHTHINPKRHHSNDKQWEREKKSERGDRPQSQLTTAEQQWEQIDSEKSSRKNWCTDTGWPEKRAHTHTTYTNKHKKEGENWGTLTDTQWPQQAKQLSVEYTIASIDGSECVCVSSSAPLNLVAGTHTQPIHGKSHGYLKERDRAKGLWDLIKG